MKVCFTGDSIMLSPPSDDYWKDNELVKLIKQCDVRSTNLEMVLSGGNAFGSTFCGEYWLTTDRKRIEDLAKYGFNHYSMANNHTMDYSYRGLELTLECLDRLGFSHSGAGKSLDAATEASIVKSSGGACPKMKKQKDGNSKYGAGCSLSTPDLASSEGKKSIFGQSGGGNALLS